MPFKNSYQLPPKRTFDELHETTAAEDYDVNFLFPVRELRSDKVIVTPFIPSLHAADYMEAMHQGDAKATFAGLNWGPFDTLREFLQYVEVLRAAPTSILFAVIDTTGGKPTFAGVVNYWLGNRRTLSIELGSVMTTVAFRRTHVTTHAAGLLMAYALAPPSASSPLLSGEGGLGLRRIQWTAFAWNGPSIRCALRLGFTAEGILRNWYETPSTPAKGKRDERLVDVGRGSEWAMEPAYDEGGERTARGFAEDSWMGSVTSADWDDGVAGALQAQMAREK